MTMLMLAPVLKFDHEIKCRIYKYTYTHYSSTFIYQYRLHVCEVWQSLAVPSVLIFSTNLI